MAGAEHPLPAILEINALRKFNTMAMDPAQLLVQDALNGREPAVRALVARLTPVIQARVARRVLARGSMAGGRAPREMVEDLTQEALLLLFADDARILRTWQPSRGLSIENFAGLVATRRALSILRTGKRSRWLDEPSLAEDFDTPTAEPDPERHAASRQELRVLLGRLREALSPLGWRLFDLLMIQEQPIDQVHEATALSRDALYAWRSRLRKLAHRLLSEIRATPTAKIPTLADGAYPEARCQERRGTRE